MNGMIAKWGATAALALPLLGLGAGWAVTHVRAQQGEEWLVPVQGYDPRDLLRGHYIQFRYDWPLPPEKPLAGTVDVMAEVSRPMVPDTLCIEGSRPNISRASRLEDESKQQCAAIARAQWGAREEIQGLETGIIFVPQTAAGDLEAKLANPKLQGLVRVRIRDDGVMRPVALEFRPRPAPQS